MVNKRKTSVRTEEHAEAVFALYRIHGIGPYNNWLTMKHDCLDRAKVVNALRFPETREQAKEMIKSYRATIMEIQSMLAESGIADTDTGKME